MEDKTKWVIQRHKEKEVHEGQKKQGRKSKGEKKEGEREKKRVNERQRCIFRAVNSLMYFFLYIYIIFIQNLRMDMK